MASLFESGQPGKRQRFRIGDAPSLFPFRDEGKILNVNSIWLLARGTDPVGYSVVLSRIPPPPAPPPGDSDTFPLAQDAQYAGLHFFNKTKQSVPPLSDIAIDPLAPPIRWQLKMTGPGPGGNLGEKEVEDIFLVLGYEWD